MRKVTGGNGQDTTSAVLAYLTSGQPIRLATIYLIGEPEDPLSIWLTDWDTPLQWSWWGTFFPAVVTRDSISSEIGLTVAQLNLEWSSANTTVTTDTNTTSPYQQALLGKLDGAPFRSWTVYMPTPGDANTLGASELFGGTIGDTTIERGKITFKVNSGLYVVNQLVPGAVVESTNTLAGMSGAVPPVGSTSVPTFTVVSASNTKVVGSGGTYSFGAFTNGFLYFLTGALAGQWSAVFENGNTVSGDTTFTLGQPLPFPPSAGDTFYVSANLGAVISGSGIYPFPYVPAPEQAS